MRMIEILLLAGGCRSPLNSMPCGNRTLSGDPSPTSSANMTERLLLRDALLLEVELFISSGASLDNLVVVMGVWKTDSLLPGDSSDIRQQGHQISANIVFPIT